MDVIHNVHSMSHDGQKSDAEGIPCAFGDAPAGGRATSLPYASGSTAEPASTLGSMDDLFSSSASSTMQPMPPAMLASMPASMPASMSDQLCQYSTVLPYFLAAAAAATMQSPQLTSTPGHYGPSPFEAGQPHAPAVALPYRGAPSPFPMALGNRILTINHGREQRSKRTNSSVPPVEHTRCFWALVTTSKKASRIEPWLSFLHFDPVMRTHLDKEADALRGTGLLDLVHPSDAGRVSREMSDIIDSDTPFGTVVRCRIKRCTAIRRSLGAVHVAEPAGWARLPDAERDHVAMDVVVNCVGENMALCFFHAVVDKSDRDYDSVNKSDWSNWCGTRAGTFDEHECQAIWDSIRSCRQGPPPSPIGPLAVFQILSSSSSPNILFSWPPPRLFDSSTRDTITAASSSFADGSYFADDFAMLAQGLNPLPDSSHCASTSCTSRFRAKHTLTSERLLRTVESVLIPYASITMACFRITDAQVLSALPPPTTATPMTNASSSSLPPSARGLHRRSTGTMTSQPNPFRLNLLNADLSSEGEPAAPSSPISADSDLSSHYLSSTALSAGYSGSVSASSTAGSGSTKRCRACGTANSPEWRKGTDGTKCLCNACGLRYARTVSRARKQEEMDKMTAEVATNGGVIPAHMRKRFEAERDRKKARNAATSVLRKAATFSGHGSRSSAAGTAKPPTAQRRATTALPEINTVLWPGPSGRGSDMPTTTYDHVLSGDPTGQPSPGWHPSSQNR